MKLFTAMLVTLAALVAGVAGAQPYPEGPVGTKEKGMPAMGNDGTDRYFVKTDAQGRLISATPFTSDGVVIVSALSLSSNVANSNNPLTGAGLQAYSTSGENGIKWARILVTGAPTNSPPWSIRFYGSRDAVTYAPLLNSIPLASGGAFVNQSGQLDTLKVRGRGAMSGNGMWFNLSVANDQQIPLKYITAVCSSDSTLSTPYIFTVEIAGRVK